MSQYSGTDNLEVMQEAINYNRFLSDLIANYASPEARVLDYGAGIGTFASRIRDAGYEIECLEVDKQQASVIRQLGITSFTSGSEVADATYDYVYSLNVLEHIEDDRKAMADIYRCLKPGGKALIYLPAMQCLFSAMDYKVGHYRRYSRRSLIECAGAVGFDIQQCSYADSLGFFATMLYKLIGNASGDINKPALVFYDRFAFPISLLFDKLFGRLFGKNVFAVLVKP